MSEQKPDEWYRNSLPGEPTEADADPDGLTEWAKLTKGMHSIEGETVGVTWVRVDRYMKTRVFRPTNPRLIVPGPDWYRPPVDGSSPYPESVQKLVGKPRPAERFRGFQVKPKP
jgi:hypothetical protein